MLLGKCLQAEEAFDAAAEAFGRVSLDSSRHEEASLSRAFAYLHHLRFDAGEEALVRHLEQYPPGPEHPDSQAAREELKWIYFNQFRRRELEQLLQTSLARHPGDYALLADLLNIEFRRQLAQEGIGHLKSVNQKQPGQPSVLLALGFCHWQLGDVKTAWEQIQAAMDLRPEHLETRLVAAEILLEQNQLESAEALLAAGDGASTSLKERFQKDDRWWWLRSKLAEVRGDDELALEYLEKALALRPSELQYVHRRGVLQQVLGRTEEAAETFADAKQLELCESRLNEIVRSGALEYPTVDVCLEVADLCEKRGRKLQADGWRYGARQLQP
jgi:tetratricopeptide (TPR) repeat protein